MVLVGFSISDVSIGMLWVSLVVLVIYIGYKKLLKYMSRGSINHESYCELYTVEDNPISGEMSFYFISNEIKKCEMSIYDLSMDIKIDLFNKECLLGGNIIRFDSTKLPNGEYFYQLKTANQKIEKKIAIFNV